MTRVSSVELPQPPNSVGKAVAVTVAVDGVFHGDRW